MMRFPTLTWGINQAYAASFDRAQAAVLALLLVVLALIVVIGERSARGQVPRQAARAVAPRVIRRRMLVSLLPVVAVAPIIGVAVPLLGLLARLLEAETLRGLDVARLLAAVGSTVGVAVGAALLAVLLALPVAALASRYRGRLVSALESVSYLGHALPGIVVGLSLVFFALAVVPALYQSVVVLVFAYAVLFAPRRSAAMRAGLGDVPLTARRRRARTQQFAPAGVVARDRAAGTSEAVGIGACWWPFADPWNRSPATLLLRPHAGCRRSRRNCGTDTVNVE